MWLSSKKKKKKKKKIHVPMQETWIQSLGQEDPWRRKRQPIPVFLPGGFRGQRSLADYSPWGHKSWTRLSD